MAFRTPNFSRIKSTRCVASRLLSKTRNQAKGNEGKLSFHCYEFRLVERLWVVHIDLSRLFPNFRRGTGFLSKLYTPSERGCSEIYGVVTNNHVLPSETYAKNAIVTFGYDRPGEGEKVKLKPKIMFRTEKVSTYAHVIQCKLHSRVFKISSV